MSVGDSAKKLISIHALGREGLLVLSCGLLSGYVFPTVPKYDEVA